MTTLCNSTDSHKDGIRTGEIVRKTLHMLPGFLPFALVLVPHPETLDRTSLLVVAAITVALTAIYLLSHRVVRRPDEDNFLSTALSYPAVILFMLIVFPQHAEFTCVVVVVLALGDGSAYLGGKLFGKRRLPWNSDKTWAGLFSFILVAGPIAALAYWLEANASAVAYWGNRAEIAVPASMALVCGVTAALCGSLAESLPMRITDNLRVGIAASAAVIIAHYAAAGWLLG